MKGALLALLLYIATQLVCSAAALLAVNGPSLLAGGELDAALLLRHPEYSGVALLAGQSVLLVLLRLLPRRAGRPAVKWGVAGWAGIVGATLLMSVGSTLLLAPLELPDGGMVQTFEGMKDNVLCLLLLCLVGPVTEEAVFRGAVLGNLWRGGMAPALAVAVSAAAFAVVHGNWAQAVPAVMGGVLFGTLYVCGGDLRAPAAAHVVNNVLAVLALFFPALDGAVSAVTPPVAVGAGCVLLGGSAGIMAALWHRVHSNCV